MLVVMKPLQDIAVLMNISGTCFPCSIYDCYRSMTTVVQEENCPQGQRRASSLGVGNLRGLPQEKVSARRDEEWMEQRAGYQRAQQIPAEVWGGCV